MPQYQISVPGQGTFLVESPTELTDAQAWQAVQSQLSAVPAQPAQGALVSGFKSYVPSLQETYGGLKTLLGVGAERVIGEGAISKGLIESGAASMAEAEKARAPLMTKERGSFTDALDKGVGSVLTEWLPFQAGAGAAQVLEALALVGAGGLAGTATAPGPGTIVGAGTGLVARELAKRGVKEAAEKILKERGEDAAKVYFEKAAKDVALEIGKKRGQTAALAGQAAFYGTGQTTSRAVEEAEKLGGTATDIELARVLPASAVATVAEFLGDKIALGALKGIKPGEPGKFVAADLAKNILLNIGLTGTKEVPVEVIQSAAERFGAKLSLTDAQALKEYIDSTAASYGMAVGPGGAGGVRQTMAERANKPAVAPAPKAPTAEAPPVAPPPIAPDAGLEQLTPQQKQELERQRALTQRPKTTEELLAETAIQTGRPTTAQDIFRIRDEHETAVIEGLLAQDAEMARANELARRQLELESEAEATAGGISDVDTRVREGRIFARVQDLIDRNIPFASTAINEINQKFGVINEAPLNEEERARIENIMGMVNTFTNFVNLPVLAPKPVDQFAENQAMEALIKERTERGQAQPLRTTTPAPSPSVQKAPVSQGVGEGPAVRPTGGVEPSAPQDRQLVTPAPVAPAAPPTPFTAPGGFVSSLTLSPAYEGIEPLSVEDADFELEALQNSAEKGRLTPEQFAGSEIGKRLDTAQIFFINEGLRVDPVGAITALRDRLKQATAAPAAPPVAPAPVVETAAPAEKVTPKTGDFVKLTVPGVGGPVGRAGKVEQILPSGDVEVRTQQGEIVSKPAGEVTVVAPAAQKAEAPAVEESTEKPVKAAAIRKQPNTVMGSTMLADISNRLGGLDLSLLSEFSTKFLTKRKDKYGRPMTMWRNPLIKGVGKLFRKGGESDYVLIATMLEEAGYLESGSVERDYKEAGERAKELIKAALNRQEVTTLEQQEKQDQADEEANRQAWHEQQEELKAERDKAAREAGLTPYEGDLLTDDDIDLFPTEAQTDAEYAAGMRAMGFEETEIADAVQKKQERERAQKAAPGRPAEARAVSETGEGAEGLASYTPEEVTRKQEEAEQAAAAEKKAKAAEQERLRKEQQAKEEKARADETVKDFELGKSAEEQMTGMGDLFAEPPAPAAPSVGGFRRATAREADSDNAQFVYDVGNGARLLFVPSQNGDVYVAAPGKGASLVVRTGDNRDNVIKTVDQFPDYIPENIRQIVLDYHKAVQGKTTDEEQTAVAMEMAEKIEALTSPKKEAPPKREPRQGTPKQLEAADIHAKETGGTVVYQDGDIALVRGYSVFDGQPVYAVTNGDYRARFDIEGYTGNLVTPEQKFALIKIKQELEAEDKAKFDKQTSIKFTDGLATSANISPEIAGIVRGWKDLLGLKVNIYITTIDDAIADRNKFTGPHRAIGSSGLDSREAGVVRKLPNGDYYIAFKKSTSKTKMLEVIAHELGHIHEREVFNRADKETRQQILDEHSKWLKKQTGKTAREFVTALRAKTAGKTTRIGEGMMASELDADYWKAFKEWYADQVSRWAVTSEKPVSVVEKFFSRLAQALKSFYSKLKNAGYLPNETFVQYLNKTHAPSDRVISTDDGAAQQMLGEVKATVQKTLQKQPMPEKGLSHVSPELTNLAQPIFFPQNKTILDRIDSMKDRFWQRLAQGTADQFRTIKEYSPTGYMQARLSKSVDGSLEGLLFHGQVFDDGGALNIKKNTKGMMDILKPIGAELDSYLMWVALNRESRLPENKRSKIPNMDQLVARRSEFAAGELNGKPRVEVYQDVLRQMNQLNKSVLDIALAKGLIDQKGYDTFSNDIYYIPFYKKMEEDGTVEGAKTASGLTSQEFSKELKGSEAPFGDLMENIVRNWSHILSASMKNAAAQTTVKDAMELQAAEPNLKAGLEWRDGKVYSTKNDKPIEAKFDEDGKQIYAEGELRPDLTTNAAGMAKIMVNGQPMYFKITDDLLMESISSIGYMGPKSKFLDVMRDFKNMLQFGVTASPIFKVNNLIRDSVSALAVSDLKKSPVYNVMTGISLSKNDSPTYISALAGGAIFNFGSAYEGDQAKLIKRLLDQGVDGETILDSPDKIKKALKKTWDAYQELGNRSEAANRLSLYQQLRDKGMSHLEASFMARDLLDFSMQGSWGTFRFLTQVVPFMNARIQGLYKLGRDGINPTVRVLYNATTGKEITANDKIRAAQFATVTSAVMLASALLYLTFKDDEDYKKRDAWDRDNFWWFKIPSLDIAFRIPKPFEVGAFGTLVERSLEQILDEGAEGKQFGESLNRTLWDTFALNPMPQIFKPLSDIYANKDSFSGAPIESAGLERLSKPERMTDMTSPLGIAMSRLWSSIMPEKFEASPVQMDYAIKGYFGWLGAMASLASTYAVMPFKEGEYPDARWLDRASLGLVRDLPAPQSAYVTAFYNSSKEITQAYADMRHYREMGDAEKVQEMLEEKGDKIALAKFYDKTAKNIANVRKQIQLITNDKNLDGAEKKEMIERMKLIMSDLAKQAEEVRKSMKP